MNKERLVFILGILIAILSYSGFPVSWKKFFYLIIGLGLAYTAYLLYKEKKMMQNNAKKADSNPL